MAVAEKLSESLIGRNIARAVADVFKTMLGRSVTPLGTAPDGSVIPWPDTQPGLPPGIRATVGQVGFVGEVNGFTYLYFAEAFAKECVGQMLGFDAREIAAMEPDTIKDAVGELANMTVGSFKNGLCDAGFPCTLTIPSVMSVCDFSVVTPPRWAHRYLYVFESGGQRVLVDVLLKVE